ncbi:tripartite tricarboxylate transporter TctB family protein [Pseudooceanicola sp. CBS1P-1]|uniref:Tripartite tricarboxylate transporter n=1 Tax=Pseudooceanicola albus TaxID=2692189 RepID=A0A6L7G751_9RHOB|nr:MULTISPECIES: tripartite tricarboxylate transporter TctB family protein [Pseudooceanicola]MBT9386809.1 tripartite tricarboxylate transporter TctB family protein [Pseudooceanicola endophyticus]MXN19368.1 tripartite tricarboxylate transporter [Pseudooceanicola albus]
MGNLTHVTINFKTSHLIFPTIIACVLGVLLVAIVIRDRKRIAASGAYWRDTWGAMDKPRFLGALALTLVYFSLMVPVGNIWPNTGLGFLLCSIPYVLATGILFMHERTPRAILPLLIVALVGPTFVWWLFTYPLFLTLP